MSDVVMPRLSDTMEAGTISGWLRADGDEIAAGDPIAEVDTDKATVVVTAEATGRLRLLFPEGADIAVGQPMARVLSDAEYAEASAAQIDPQPAAPLTTTPVPPSPPPSEGPHAQKRATVDRLRASPVARRLAGMTGVDLTALAGSGPEGRVLKTDVLRASGADASPAGRSAQPLNRMRLAIARRTSEAKRTIPHFYLSTDVDMTDANALRRQIGDGPVSLTDLIVRACAIALARLPEVNAAWSDRGLVTNETVNVGIAVALDDGGLVVPVVRNADARTLVEISADVRRLVELARSGKIAPTDLSEGTFTVSNLGMYGIREFHAIINPPESGILAVGSVVKTPVVRHADTVVVREMMTMSLSADHRVYSGATGAEFLQSVRLLLEHPLELFLPANATGGAGRPG